MLRLARPIVPALVVAAAIAAPVSSAAAATTHRDVTNATVKKASGSLPNVTYTGTVNSSVLGRGTVHQVVHINGLKVTGEFVITYAKGTLRGTVKARAKITLKGAVFTGTEKVTGGTGRYKGATGSGSYSGTGPLNMSSATFRQTGTIRF